MQRSVFQAMFPTNPESNHARPCNKSANNNVTYAQYFQKSVSCYSKEIMVDRTVTTGSLVQVVHGQKVHAKIKRHFSCDEGSATGIILPLIIHIRLS